MPAFAFTRQPDALAWFGSGHGGPILASEHARVSQALTSRSPQPWLWVSPLGGDPAHGAIPATRGVRLLATATLVVLAPDDDQFETIAGFLMYVLRKVPRPTESVDHGGFRFEVLDVDHHHIDQLLVTRVEPVLAEKPALES